MTRSIEKKSDKTFLIHLKINPNSKKQGIIENQDFFTVSIKAKPVKNKANIELIKYLREKLKFSVEQIKIISGLKTRKKIVEIKLLDDMTEEQINKKFLE